MLPSMLSIVSKWYTGARCEQNEKAQYTVLIASHSDGFLSLESRDDLSRGKGYPAAAIQGKTVKQLLFDLAEAHLHELER